MKRVGLLLLLFTFKGYSQTNNEIKLVSQNNSQRCWAAVLEMLTGKNQIKYTHNGTIDLEKYLDIIRVDFPKATAKTGVLEEDVLVSRIKNDRGVVLNYAIGSDSHIVLAIDTINISIDNASKTVFMNILDPWPTGKGMKYFLNLDKFNLIPNQKSDQSIAKYAIALNSDSILIGNQIKVDKKKLSRIGDSLLKSNVDSFINKHIIDNKRMISYLNNLNIDYGSKFKIFQNGSIQYKMVSYQDQSVPLINTWFDDRLFLIQDSTSNKVLFGLVYSKTPNSDFFLSQILNGEPFVGILELVKAEKLKIEAFFLSDKFDDFITGFGENGVIDKYSIDGKNLEKNSTFFKEVILPKKLNDFEKILIKYKKSKFNSK